MSEKIKPGSLCTDETQLGRRDAFHCPAVVVTSKDLVRAGDPVRFLSPTEVAKTDRSSMQAVVDPFLSGYITLVSDQMFWVFVMPELISDLTHHFGIKGMPEPAQTSEEPKPPTQAEVDADAEDAEFDLCCDEAPEPEVTDYCNWSNC